MDRFSYILIDPHLGVSSSLQEALKAIRETVLEVISYWESWRELGGHVTLPQLQREKLAKVLLLVFISISLVKDLFKISWSPRKSLWDSLIWHHWSTTIIEEWEDSSTRRPHSDPALSCDRSGGLILSVFSLPFGREVLKQQNTKWLSSPVH